MLPQAEKSFENYKSLAIIVKYKSTRTGNIFLYSTVYEA